MTSEEVLVIANDAVSTLIHIALPIMLVALFVGLAVSLFQALTQIQEMTLTFVPKIITIFFSLLIFLPYISTTLADFTRELFQRIAGAG
ncbi:MAG: flagellar biosynthesis protein FliQ [Hyphomicrobiales bacterium]|nr:flagellar biosynthesis protein FliQ [Hyphomicrobiales bacterium]